MRKITSIIMFLISSVLLFSEGSVLWYISSKVEVRNTNSTGFGAAFEFDDRKLSVAKLETSEVYISFVTKPSQTDITIIGNDYIKGDDNEN